MRQFQRLFAECKSGVWNGKCVFTTSDICVAAGNPCKFPAETILRMPLWSWSQRFLISVVIGTAEWILPHALPNPCKIFVIDVLLLQTEFWADEVWKSFTFLPLVVDKPHGSNRVYSNCSVWSIGPPKRAKQPKSLSSTPPSHQASFDKLKKKTVIGCFRFHLWYSIERFVYSSDLEISSESMRPWD